MSGWLDKLIGFVTGGLPSEIAKQVGESIRAKGERQIKEFMGSLSYDLELLRTTAADPLHTRQVIALTFHFFMWATRIITGSFPHETIFTWGTTKVTIGAVYIVIILFYFPWRSIEKWRQMNR